MPLPPTAGEQAAGFYFMCSGLWLAGERLAFLSSASIAFRVATRWATWVKQRLSGLLLL